jgi:putative ABC transport system substrate-binding protein
MKRREFIGLLGGAATWPLAARAQQPGKLPTVGFFGSANPATMGPWVAAFVQRLHELSWIENRTVAIEYRWAEGRSERHKEIAAELVRLKVDVIVTGGTTTAAATKAATVGIPIVFALGADPVGSGLVASLARPGGNVTGLSLQSSETAGKRLALLREIVPNLRRVAFMGNVDNPIVPVEWREVEAAASTLGLAWRSGARRISCPPSRRSTSARRLSISPMTASSTPTVIGSTSWRWARDCRPPGRNASWSRPEVSCPTDRASATYSGARPT